MNHAGMKYSLPSRETDSRFGGNGGGSPCLRCLVFIPNCDKIIPGMIMAALRLNIPSIFISGGPMMAGKLGSEDGAETVDPEALLSRR